MSLSPIWELAGKGYAITAVDYEDVPANERLGFYSRFVSGRELLNDETFCQQIEKIAKENRPVLLPGNRRSLEHMIDYLPHLLHELRKSSPFPSLVSELEADVMVKCSSLPTCLA